MEFDAITRIFTCYGLQFEQKLYAVTPWTIIQTEIYNLQNCAYQALDYTSTC